MAKDDEILVRLGADTQGVEAGMKRAQAASERATKAMRDDLGRFVASSKQANESLTRSFSGIAEQFKTMAVGFVGLQSARALINMSDQATMAAARMAQVTGSVQSATEASRALFSMAQRLQAPLAEVQASFTRITPAVKELGGGVREATALTEVLVSTAKLSGASAAEAASSAMQFAQALGSGKLNGDELRSILENNQVLARELSGALGITIGDLRKMGEQGKLTSDVVANALLGRYGEIKSKTAELPQTVGGAFTQIANAFTQALAEINKGGGVFAYLSKALSEVAKVIEIVAAKFRMLGTDSQDNSAKATSFAKGVGLAFSYVVDIVGAVLKLFQATGESIGALAAAVAEFSSGNVSGAKNIMAEQLQLNAGYANEVKKAFTGAGDAVQAYLAIKGSEGDYSNEGRGAAGGGGFAKLKGKGKPDQKGSVERFEMELQQQKLAYAKQQAEEGTYYAWSLAKEEEFWRAKARVLAAGSEERLAVDRKVIDLQLQQAQQRSKTMMQGFEEELAREKVAYLQRQSEAGTYKAWSQSNEDAFWDDKLDKVTRGTAEYFAIEKRLNDSLIRQKEQSNQQLAQAEAVRRDARVNAALGAVDLEEQAARSSIQSAFTSQQERIAQEEQFESRRLQIKLDALQAELAAEQENPNKNPARIAGLHAEIEQLWQQHQLRMAQITAQTSQEVVQPLNSIMGAMTNGLAQAMDGLITRTMTLRQALTQAWAGIRSAIVGEIAKIITKQIAQWAVTKALALAGIGADTAKAGSGAASAMASIPYVGPILAIAAMASMFSQVGAAKGMVPTSVPSASKGFDIPAGLNPLTQLHEKEMVLPAYIAEPLRENIDGGGMGGAPVHIHGRPDDTVKLSDLATLMKSLNRNFAFV